MWTLATVALVVAAGQAAQITPEGPADDAIARLVKQIDRGETVLNFREDGSGYLPSLLERLDVHVDSQVLVFSKTSFQQAQISPRAPRAVYFSDSVAVGSVQGGQVYELMAVDKSQGIIFYTMNTQKSDKPHFERRGVECLFCHGPGNKGVPGFVVASVVPNAEGVPFFAGSFFSTIDHRTPFDQRWGGWYVTGTHGDQKHLGNSLSPDPDRPLDLDQTGALNLTSLSGKLDVSKYLVPTSDIVALMTLEHQTGMTNLIVRVGSMSRRAQYVPSADRTAGNSLDAGVDEMVTYMLFADEAPLAAPVEGVSTFTKTFAQRGPHDKQGRSLRDFDLKKRLFRYPLSYMVYSEAFDGMPKAVLDRVYRRLYDVLTGKDVSAKFASIAPADRQAVLEILRDTKPNLPEYWRSSSDAP
jgi:hypothetical protein